MLAKAVASARVGTLMPKRYAGEQAISSATDATLAKRKGGKG